jgi:16S rRNA (cytidine1402-2'-O)-methyltransferase
MPTLYLVGTPIGNLEDITLRALRTLREVTLIAAEDTRTTGRLLKHFQIATPMLSYHEHNEAERTAQILAHLAQGDVALVSDAGMPGLSDPGYRLVAAAAAAGVTVSPIPGPTAAITALVSSGLPTDQFLFLGFLPRQRAARRSALAAVAKSPYTLLLYEAPHRLLSLLEDLLAVCGDRPIAVGRELTKLHEEIWRGPVSEAIRHFEQGKVRGELTLVISPAEAGDAEPWSEADVRMALREQLAQGASRSAAAAFVAARAGWRKRDVYALTLIFPET